MRQVTVTGPLRLPRRFKSHLGSLGGDYRRHFCSLEQALGPFTSELVREAAADAAQAHCVKLQAVRAWEEALVQRREGTGRRPNAAWIIRLSKRVALESSSYQLAVRRLEELVARTRAAAPSVAGLFAERS